VGVTSILGRLAAKSTPSVFVAAGMGAAEVVAQLEASGEIHRVASPAAATVLLVVGGIPPALESSVAAVHDGMPHPRFHGLTGNVVERRGDAFIIEVYSGNKLKTVISRPEHLVLITPAPTLE